MPITIRPATAADATGLSTLARETFVDAFAADNDPADLAAYVDAAFTPGRQTAELADPAVLVLLAEVRDDAGTTRLAGYAHLVRGAAPECVTGPDPLELKRLYVVRAWHGGGVARALLDAVLDAARTQGARTLWLGVWERNARALRFYAKHGFVHVGAHEFLLGRDRQTDWLMARAVDAPVRVVAAVVARGDRLLVCQRPAEKRHGGLWEFPGGKCEPGESDADAVRRELREELGVEVREVGPEELAIGDPGSPFLIVFLPVEIEGEPVALEHDALAWGTPAELARLPLAPSDRRYVESRMERA